MHLTLLNSASLLLQLCWLLGVWPRLNSPFTLQTEDRKLQTLTEQKRNGPNLNIVMTSWRLLPLNKEQTVLPRSPVGAWLEGTEVIKVDHSVSPKILGQRKGPVCQAGEQKNSTGRLWLFVLPSDAGRDSSACHLDSSRCNATVLDLGWIAYAGELGLWTNRLIEHPQGLSKETWSPEWPLELGSKPCYASERAEEGGGVPGESKTGLWSWWLPRGREPHA